MNILLFNIYSLIFIYFSIYLYVYIYTNVWMLGFWLQAMMFCCVCVISCLAIGIFFCTLRNMG